MFKIHSTKEFERKEDLQMEEMMIIEGLKKLKLFKKKIATNAKLIEEYSSILSTERPVFDSEAEQRKQVQSLVQANMDLNTAISTMKQRIDLTNLLTRVKFFGREWTIHEMIQHRRNLIVEHILPTYNALSNKGASARFRNLSNVGDAKVVCLFDEKEKQKQLAEWNEIKETIDSRLETVNATTRLLDLNEVIVRVIG